jgi:thymidine kinase
MDGQIRGNLGWIEVICGSMFSGKSEELIRRLRRAQIARQRVQIFKPRIDNRYAEDHIVSHSEQKIASQVVTSSQEIMEFIDIRTEVIGIDEVQFFDKDIVNVCNRLADMGKRVIVAGLDQDYMGRPFDPVPQILAVAEYITKTLAICMRCGNPANRTQRLIQSEERVVVGAADIYEARCRRCFEPLPPAQVLAQKPLEFSK